MPRTATHVVRSLDPRYGGTSVSVPQLATATAHTGRYSNLLVEFHGDGETCPVQSTDEMKVLSLPWAPGRLFLEAAIPGSLSAAVKEADVVHAHGLWRTHCIASGILARKYKKPFVVSAHGMLEPWALKNKGYKKVPYSYFLERPNLDRSSCLRALTSKEAEEYRDFGATGPIAVIPNGINIPSELSPDRFHGEFPALRNYKLLLFLGRIHYKKGVDLLCRAWAKLHQSFPDWHLVLAGPDFEGTAKVIEEEISRLQIADRVTLTGMLQSDMKWSALAASAVFTLPSHSEGFSVAVLEALAAGLPAIISEQCNFPEVGQTASGWLIQPNETDLTNALRDCFSASDSDRAGMGERGIALVKERYNWEGIGEQMAETYDWLLGGPLPVKTEIIRPH